jgi:hypothetical protein
MKSNLSEYNLKKSQEVRALMEMADKGEIPITSPAEARKQNKLHYFSGKKCVNGHSGFYYVKTDVCVHCCRDKKLGIRRTVNRGRVECKCVNENCQKTFFAPASVVKNGGAKFCGMKCFYSKQIKEYDLTPISRDEAAAKGLTRFFTGVKCLRGHVAPRLVKKNECVECIRDRSASARDLKIENRYHHYVPKEEHINFDDSELSFIIYAGLTTTHTNYDEHLSKYDYLFEEAA